MCIRDRVNAVLSYLENPDKMDADAVNTLIEEACCIDTYSPCYATLVPRLIRGKYRVYLDVYKRQVLYFFCANLRIMN